MSSFKAKIVKDKKLPNTFTLTMNLTEGELLAVKYALENRDTSVAQDVHGYLMNAYDNAGIKP